MKLLTNSEWIDEWNKQSIKFTKEESKGAIKKISSCGLYATYQTRPELINHRNNRMADWLEEVLDRAKSAYYKKGEIIMEDKTYDWLEGNLKVLRPDSKFLKKVGFDLEEENNEE